MPSEQPTETETNEPQRVITVRLPASLHKALEDEAQRLSILRGQDVSLNQLCVEFLKEPL